MDTIQGCITVVCSIVAIVSFAIACILLIPQAIVVACVCGIIALVLED